VEVYDYQIIANLLSGKGLARQKLAEIKGYLDSQGITYRVLELARRTPISQIPSDGRIIINKGVICIGGDGTVSETIGYVKKRNLDVPIIIVPTGTANFIAGLLGAREDLSPDRLLSGRGKNFDLGVYQCGAKTDYFLIGMGYGFEQRFLAIAKDTHKKLLGKLTYFASAFRELFRLKPINYRLKFDGKNLEVRAAMLVVLNFRPKLTAFLPLAVEEDVKYDDGALDVYLVEHKSFIHSFFGILLFHLMGKYTFGLVQRYRAKKVEIAADEPSASQVDGEMKGQLPVKISLISRGINFLV